MDKRKCQLCGESHDYQSGFFTRHLFSVHNITLKEYVIRSEYDGIPPICKCGLCELEPEFQRGRFKSYRKDHRKHEKQKELYIEK